MLPKNVSVLFDVATVFFIVGRRRGERMGGKDGIEVGGKARKTERNPNTTSS
jgi:hypothetical protein